jgi:hypothetical protein
MASEFTSRLSSASLRGLKAKQGSEIVPKRIRNKKLRKLKLALIALV